MRWIRSAAILSAMAAGIAGIATASPAAAAARDPYSVCLLPGPCPQIVAAQVTGEVIWDANRNTYQARNFTLPAATVTFTEIAGGVIGPTRTIPIPRGANLAGTTTVRPITNTLRITLCTPAINAPRPNCATTEVTRD